MAFQVSNQKGPQGSRPPMRPAMTPSGPSVAPSRPKQSWIKGLVTLIVVIVIIGGGIYLIADFSGFGIGANQTILSSDWQAVFLTNGQVYFGQASKIGSEFVILKNIYYLQVVTLQDTLGQSPEVQTESEQRLTLIKLGSEIHGPKDEMMINRDHVILIEDLKDDGRVVQAINNYISGNQNQPIQ